MTNTNASGNTKTKNGSWESDVAGYMNLISGFSKIAAGGINYSLLKTANAAANISADSIQTRAVERSNQLREQYLNSMGSFLQGSTRRGIRASSDIVAKNIERSSKNLGEDIQKMTDNAKYQSDAIKSQNKLRKIRGKAAYVDSILGAVPDLMAGWSTLSESSSSKK